MERWHNKIAVVTGASSGIGAAVTIDLIKNGLIVVGLARRVERVEEIRLKLPENVKSNLHPYKCDVTNESEVVQCFEWIKKTLGGTDILVNNAGIARFGNLSGMDSKSIQDVLNTNVMAFTYCTREAFKSMKERNVDGHIVVINSVLGHYVPDMEVALNIYPPSKFAVTAMTEIYRQEFAKLNTTVKITSVSPGLVNTEIVPEEWKGNSQPILQPEDVSGAVLYTIGTPPHVQVQEIMIKPLVIKR